MTLANTGGAAVGVGVGWGVGVLVQAASARAAITQNRFIASLYAHLSARPRRAAADPGHPREAAVAEATVAGAAAAAVASVELPSALARLGSWPVRRR